MKEGIMNHNFPCSPQGGKLNPTCCIGKTILIGICETKQLVRKQWLPGHTEIGQKRETCV